MSIEPAAVERQTQLDGLRGLAALSVFLLHVSETPNWPRPEGGLSPLSLVAPLWDGSAAVVLFFVLSGFVLALPYTGTQRRPIDTVPFLLRRLFRLYPLYWVAVATALFLRFVVFQPAGLEGLSVWINTIWNLPFHWSSLPGHMVLIAPGVDSYHLDPVVWSLAAEIKVSLIYPAVILMLRRCRSPYWVPVILGLFVALDLRFHALGHLTLFLFGGFLAAFREPVVAVLGRLRWLRYALLPLAYFLYGVVCFFPQLPPIAVDQIAAAGSTLWIALFLSSSTLRAMGNAGPVHFIGKVSYSFYLMHLPILMAVTSWIYPRTHSMLTVAVVALVLSLCWSWVTYKLVESPTQNWGRSMGKAWTGWRGARKGAVAA